MQTNPPFYQMCQLFSLTQSLSTYCSHVAQLLYPHVCRGSRELQWAVGGTLILSIKTNLTPAMPSSCLHSAKSIRHQRSFSSRRTSFRRPLNSHHVQPPGTFVHNKLPTATRHNKPTAALHQSKPTTSLYQSKPTTALYQSKLTTALTPK